MHNLFGLDLSGNTSYVYFIRFGENGPIKIGFSKKIRKRLVNIQLNSPYLMKLMAVMIGGRSEEHQLHKKFFKYRLYGEWFEPVEELLDYINQFEKLDLCSMDFQKLPEKGENNCNWKGEFACPSAKRRRAKQYVKSNNNCDRCSLRKGIDTIFKDGNMNNLNKDNLTLYCRKCRMERDGTLDNFKNIIREKNPPKPCKICNNLTKALRHNRCGTCSEFWRRNGFERTEKKTRDLVLCNICNKNFKGIIKGKCHTCYEFYRRNGVDKNQIPIKDQEVPSIINLRLMKENNKQKADLIRDLYLTNMFTYKFLSVAAGISVSFCHDIVRNRCFIDENYCFKTKKQLMNEIKAKIITQ